MEFIHNRLTKEAYAQPFCPFFLLVPAQFVGMNRPRAAQRQSARKFLQGIVERPLGNKKRNLGFNALWKNINEKFASIAVDQVLSKATLRDLLQNEEEMNSWVRTIPGSNGLLLQ